MARWRLKAKHYLSVAGTQWERVETSMTGKPVRSRHDVPLFLDPDDPTQWTETEDGVGVICVSDGNNPHPKDLLFSGPPTPDMEPIDEDAKRITKSESGKWIHPIESLATTYGESVEQALHKEMMAKHGARPADADVIKTLQEQMAALMQQNTLLMAHILQPQEPADVE